MMMRYLPALVLFLLPVAAGAEGLLPTHRISAELASQAVAEAVASCAKQGYAETAVLVDADGVRQAVLRGDRAGATRSTAPMTRPTRPRRSRPTPARCSSGRSPRPVSPICSRNCRT